MKQKQQTNTKQDIRNALTQLLLAEPFESISVSKLSRKAGINRGTFYLHYLDKYDMMEKLKEEVITDLQALYQSEAPAKKSILALLYYIKEHYSFFYAISQSHFTNFNQSIKDFILLLLMEIPDYENRLKDLYQIPSPYAKEVLLSCVETIVTTWIVTGAKEKPEEIGQMILAISRYDELQGQKKTNTN